ncbi:hypothetical protein NG895_24635 [Aeoliella sp. ICT_H6.2]|uniref:Uncharacterized protein n=1 Tax=Aeoliella straminimaris TaxID=2954799 RepID=A0A9X2JJ06_9BACT|nr:hypothetical protein [Aeoliella straminimaris]MCO6047097.1 hypothetical protein [Aeoliella straminimaris]
MQRHRREPTIADIGAQQVERGTLSPCQLILGDDPTKRNTIIVEFDDVKGVVVAGHLYHVDRLKESDSYRLNVVLSPRGTGGGW